ncbi:YciI family protein [Magnetovibrio sp. PR-2]|uniref:YciI family protein n=1 Tax=Magnetovibrio sp. PR-2 TaxID=3120356 RepID=UPI002FCE0621
MRFAIVCTDKPNQADTRAQHREAHFAHLDAYADQIIEAGPLLAEDGSHSVGSLLIVEFNDRASAEAFTNTDPFSQAGIFESVVIRPYKKVIPKS